MPNRRRGSLPLEVIDVLKVIVHSPVAGLLLGSVTQRLLHFAHRPVLAVPPGAPTS